jgi:two-component system phosphate regulon sensor histidine kinase PhoR
MQLSLSQKWFAGLVALLAALLLVVNLGIDCLLPPYLLDEIKGDLKRDAIAVRHIFEPDLSARPPRLADINRRAHELSAQMELRITVIAPDGTVVAESNKPLTELGKIENHLYREEVQSALKTGLGYASRYSETIRVELLYAAAAVRYGDSTGVVRVALPLHRVTEFKARVLRTVAVASLIVGLVAIPFLFWMARRTTRPILEMREVARKVAGGVLAARAGIPAGPELGGLATDLNHMAAQLETRLRELTAEKSELSAILSSMSDGVLVVNSQGKISLINDVLQRQFQLRDEVRGRTILEVFHNASLDEMVKAAAVQDDLPSRELAFSHIGEHLFDVKTAALRGAGDAFHGIVIVFHDITRIKQLENLRREFVANVSHELRTPLSIVKGYVETLLEPNPPDAENTRKFLQTIQKHSARLETLIDDLLTISSLESQQAQLNIESISLRATVEAVLGDLESQVKAREMEFRLNLPGTLPRLKADPQRLHQVLFNLLDNAIKYTPPKGQITVSARETGGEIECSVADNGPGIAAEHLPRVFERFYRVDKARSRELGGTGLGLAIVKHIVQAHGGRVWAESQVGKGSAFYFTIPKA